MGCDAFLAEKPTDSFTVGSTTNKWVAVDSFEASLTPILLTWRIGWAPNNASKWQMGFNLAFKGLSIERLHDVASKRE
jgi:hypothetical protein